MEIAQDRYTYDMKRGQINVLQMVENRIDRIISTRKFIQGKDDVVLPHLRTVLDIIKTYKDEISNSITPSPIEGVECQQQQKN